MQWEQRYVSGKNRSDSVQALAACPDGGFVAVGMTELMQPKKDSDVAFIAKYTADGKQVWRNTSAEPRTNAYSSVAVASDGSIFVVGNAHSPQHIVGLPDGVYDAGIAKYDSDGKLLWQKVFSSKKGDDEFIGVAATRDGGVVVVGNTSALNSVFPREGDKDGTDALILQFSPDGAIQWERLLPGASLGQPAVGNDGNIVVPVWVTAEWLSWDFSLPDGTSNASLVAKFSTSGKLLWASPCGSTGQTNCGSVALDSEDNVFAVGQYAHPIVGSSDPNQMMCDGSLIKMNGSTGASVWSKTYGGSKDTYFNSVVVANDGGIVIIGATMSSDGDFPIGGNDVWGQTNMSRASMVVKLSPDGALR